MSEYVNYDGLKRYDELIKNVISVKTLIGSCSTAAGTAAKVVSVESGFKLLKGVRIGVKFTNSNTASNVTLNVNNTGAKSIYYNNAVYTETSNMICGYANRYVFYVYDGTNWVWDGYSYHDNTWKAANASQEGYVPKSTANKILRSNANGALYWGNDNNTTYSSKAAEANGTDVSLVTTGEKAIWNAKTSNTGTVTKVTAGTGLTGGDITTSGTIALATSGVTAGTYKRVTVDSYGRVTSGDNTDSDTKNTAGTTNKTGTKMFLAAATEQSANPVTYSNSNCYIGTDNCLYSGGAKVLTSYTNTTYAAGTGITINGSNNAINVTYGTDASTACQGNDSRLSNARPASDVSAWAKAASKPSYGYSEIGYTVNAITSVGGTLSIDGTVPLHVVTLTGNVSALTLSANPSAGHSCHVIFTAASKYTVAIAHDATNRVCPEATDVNLTVKANGYVEIDLLNVNSKIYVRGV